jgi:hypothetical protein
LRPGSLVPLRVRACIRNCSGYPSPFTELLVRLSNRYINTKITQSRRTSVSLVTRRHAPFARYKSLFNYVRQAADGKLGRYSRNYMLQIFAASRRYQVNNQTAGPES